MKPRQKKARSKLMTFFLIFLKKRKKPESLVTDVYAIFIFLSFLIFHYPGGARFVRETEELEDEEEDDGAVMAKSSLVGNDVNDNTQNDESEGHYVLLINLGP